MSFLTRTRPLSLRVALPLVLGIAGIGATVIWNPAPLTPRDELVPKPYRVPKIPGTTALRMAMVHDALMNRYLTHSAAWYQKRSDNAQAIIAKLKDKPLSAELLNAMDDLAVGYQRCGEGEKAIALMREKLKLLPPPPADVLDPSMSLSANAEFELITKAPPLDGISRHHYTTHANLGTFLNLQSFGGLLKNEPGAREMMQEGLEHVERSIAINPGAHFGRERWQAILVHHFLVAAGDPKFFTAYSMIGDPLNEFVYRDDIYPPRGMDKFDIEDLTPGQRSYIRRNIPQVTIDREWSKATKYPYDLNPIPFDEPTLALIGTWTLGIGPNPHWSLALARLMHRLGQYNIAWEGYQRAIDMGEGFSPDPAVREKLIELCKRQQELIAGMEKHRQFANWSGQMLHSYNEELAFGTRYQAEYHKFEAEQIKAGVALDDPHFYDAFFKTHGAVASDPGISDEAKVTHLKPKTIWDFAPLTTLGVGLGMALGLLISRRRA